MNLKQFSYEKCLKEMEKFVPSDMVAIPPVDKKVNSLIEVNRIVQGYQLPILYRYMPLSMNALMSILNEDIYLTCAKDLNDAFEGAAYGTNVSFENDLKQIERIQGSVYLKSFSCARNDNLMWSHYGDSHKGICIGYDFSKASSNIQEHLYPVQYSDARFAHSTLKKVVASPFLYLRKSKDWQREKEFRLIYTRKEMQNRNRKLIKNCIKEIWLGLRSIPNERELVASIVRNLNLQREEKIELYVAKYRDNSFEMDKDVYCG